MTIPVLSKTLRATDYRLLFWLLAAQERDAAGIPMGTVPPGWRERAAADLDVGKPMLWRCQKRLVDAGIITLAPYQRTVRINGEAFG